MPLSDRRAALRLLLAALAACLLLSACDLAPTSEDARVPDALSVDAIAEPGETVGEVGALVLPEEGLELPSTRLVASRQDAGLVDVDGDGDGDWNTYGLRNRGLSVGEQGGDGHELRYVAPFHLDDAARQVLDKGARAELSFTVWRADELDGRQLVITAVEGRTGTADFDRIGTEVHRGAPKTGRSAVDVTDAVAAAGDEPVVFRFATDVPPVAGDGRQAQINVATADGREAARPTLTLTPTTASGSDEVPGSPDQLAPAAPEPEPAEPAPVPEPEPAPAPEPEPAPQPAAPPTTDGALVWSDEFDGSKLNTAVWEPYHSTYGDGNNELQCHTPNNITVSDGTAKLTARRETVTCPGGSTRQYTSAFLGTRETGTYFPRWGRFEIRAKVPHGQGLWPAFWLRHRSGSSTAEVDVMEYFHSQVPGRSTATLHLDGRYNISKNTRWFESPSYRPGFHTWAVEITPADNGVLFRFFVDGTQMHSFVDTRHRWAEQHSGKNLWDIAVNLSVGGNWVGHPAGSLGYLDELNRCAQGGTAPANCDDDGVMRAQFPATYEVDYVRVYAR